MAGITADANILINYARLSAQRYSFAYQEPIPVEQLVQRLCDLKQGYTQYGGASSLPINVALVSQGFSLIICIAFEYSGLRPFGVSFIYAGWDRTYGFQLYQSDPSGNYGSWKATCIGANNQVLKAHFFLFLFSRSPLTPQIS